MTFTRPKAAQIDFDITNITDPLIRLNSAETGSADKDVGIVIERGDDTNVALLYDESADQFVLVNTTEDGSTSGNVTISSYAGLQANAIVYGSLNDGTTTLTATVAELNILDGVTATATELNYTDGVTSNIQTQLDAKAPTATPTFTGNATFDTNTLFVDASNNRIGVGTTSPAYQVEIENTGANALLVLDRTDGAACFIEGQATRSAFGSVGATPLALAYNSLAVVTIGASGAITVNPDGGSPFTFPTADGSADQVLATNGSGTLSFVDQTGGGSGHTIQNAGVSLTDRTNLNFDGTYLVATDDSGNDQTDVTIGSGVVTTTGTQTLTNKTLTSPNLTSPSIGGVAVTATAAEINILDGVTATTAEINYVDGVTSNIQTQLDGKQASGSYLTGNQTITLSGDASGSGTTSIVVTVADDSHNHIISNVDGLQTALDAKLDSSSYTATDVLTKIKTVDGSGSGLDADLLDGIQASSFLQGGVGYTWTATGGNALSFRSDDVLENATGDAAALEVYQDTAGADAFMQFHVAGDYAAYFGLKGDINDFAVGGWSMGSTYHKVWHAGNDGAGSGLDADLLDGVSSESFLRSDTADTLATNITVNSGNYLYFYNSNQTDGNDGKIGVGMFGTGLNIVGVQSSASDGRRIRMWGNITLSGGEYQGTATAAKYADLAESYEADAEYALGTVLIFGGEKEVTQSTTKMDRRKAGVVSEKPAFKMNMDLPDQVDHAPYVALQGRVPCRVVGEVHKGDLMISSSVPGCAEAWREEGDPRYGSVIGKSLVNKTSNKEELIEVAVGVI